MRLDNNNGRQPPTLYSLHAEDPGYKGGLTPLTPLFFSLLPHVSILLAILPHVRILPPLEHTLTNLPETNGRPLKSNQAREKGTCPDPCCQGYLLVPLRGLRRTRAGNWGQRCLDAGFRKGPLPAGSTKQQPVCISLAQYCFSCTRHRACVLCAVCQVTMSRETVSADLSE
jgi:hypothetical protein